MTTTYADKKATTEERRSVNHLAIRVPVPACSSRLFEVSPYPVRTHFNNTSYQGNYLRLWSTNLQKEQDTGIWLRQRRFTNFFTWMKGYLMADDVSYLTKPKYTIVKLTNGLLFKWPMALFWNGQSSVSEKDIYCSTIFFPLFWTEFSQIFKIPEEHVLVEKSSSTLSTDSLIFRRETNRAENKLGCTKNFVNNDVLLVFQ